MKLSYKKRKRKENIFRWSVRKLFHSDVHRHLRAVPLRRQKLCIHDRFEKGKKCFCTLFSDGIFMRIMFSIGKALFSLEKVVLTSSSTRKPHCIPSLVSCVVQWKANIFCFSHSIILLFRVYHSQFPCCVYIFFHPRTPSTLKGKGGEKRKTLGRKKKKKKKLFQLSTLFRSYFCVFFRFPFIHFQSFANISLTWNNLNNICCSSRHIIHSLFLTHFVFLSSSPHFLVVVKQPRP